MSRPAYFSPSAWSRWEQCPRSWAFRYVDKIPDPGSVHTVHGLIVHRTLELLMMHAGEDRLTPLREELLEVSLDEHAEEIVAVGSDRESMRTEAMDTMLGWTATEPGAPYQADVLHVEQRLQFEVGGVPLVLVLDRVDRRKDTVVAIDYKSGRKAKVTPAYTRQMVLSAIAAEQITGELCPSSEIWFVKLGERKTVRTGAHAQATVTEDLQRAWRAVAGACIDGDFPARPSPLCNWCSYEDRCPEGQRAARAYREKKGFR